MTKNRDQPLRGYRKNSPAKATHKRLYSINGLGGSVGAAKADADDGKVDVAR
jgi:hypothetical protein